jgi:hypothetical protein
MSGKRYSDEFDSDAGEWVLDRIVCRNVGSDPLRPSLFPRAASPTIKEGVVP